VAVEHEGSTAVPELLSKPILDIAIGLSHDADMSVVAVVLQRLGYEFRGDKGDEGGLLFVLEDRPLHRIAHVHVVRFDDSQWRRYVSTRDRLRTDAVARREYEDLKRRLAKQFTRARAAYTTAKEAFISSLLERE
jgi:GrpB-like predicted nucleotidyltransferase (UPF0157 family)